MIQRSRARHVAAVLFAVLCCSGAALAGTPDALRESWRGPSEDLLTATPAAAPRFEPGMLPDSHPARFADAGDSGVLLPLADALAGNDAEREQLRIQFGMLRTAFAGEFDDDLAAAFTVFVVFAVQASNGGAFPAEKACDALYAQLASAIAESNAYVALDDGDKSAMRAWLAAMMFYLSTRYDEARKANDERRLAQVAGIAREALRVALDVDARTLSFDDKGIVRAAPEAKGKAKAKPR